MAVPGDFDPTGVRTWLDGILAEDCYNLIAWNGDTAAGYSTLISNGDDSYRLAIFILQGYQGTGFGTHLIGSLLGYGYSEGINCAWLTVERWNHAAVSLYEKMSFETTGLESFDLEVAIRHTEGD